MDGSCVNGSPVLAGAALIACGLVGATWTAWWAGPGWARLALGALVLLLTLATTAIGVVFYALCGMD
jgi:hypothetical protein